MRYILQWENLKRSNVESIFNKRHDQTIKYEFVTKTRTHAVYMFCSKQVGCSCRLTVMPLASSFTAPDLASQHSLTPLCQWHGAIKLWRFLHDYRAIELFGLRHCNLHLLWWSAKRMFCHLSIALCLRIKSLSVPLDQQHQRCTPQIAGVEGLRPPQDGFYSLVHLWCSVSFTHLNL